MKKTDLLTKLPPLVTIITADDEGDVEDSFKAIPIPAEYEGIYEPEFLDFMKVFEFGITKHGKCNWLEPDGNKSDWVTRHNSMFHHLAESFSRNNYVFRPENQVDKESGLDPLLHLIASALIIYVRMKRHIVHSKDRSN